MQGGEASKGRSRGWGERKSLQDPGRRRNAAKDKLAVGARSSLVGVRRCEVWGGSGAAKIRRVAWDGSNITCLEIPKASNDLAGATPGGDGVGQSAGGEGQEV
jgi:hypothetical protein